MKGIGIFDLIIFLTSLACFWVVFGPGYTDKKKPAPKKKAQPKKKEKVYYVYRD